MAKKGDLVRVNIYANYFLMMSMLATLFAYFTRAPVRSIQSAIFILFFTTFMFVSAHIAIKYKVVFNFGSMPLEKQPRREINKYIGYLFIFLGALLLLAIVKMVI